GHAVQQAMAQIPDSAEVLVLYGDVPLVQAPTLQRLVATAGQQALALLSVVVAQPQGYGRIVRDEHGHIIAIVEEKDASAAELGIDEINTGLMCAPAATLRAWLARLNNDNAQAEYYLTDCIGMAAKDGVPVLAEQPNAAEEVHGINDKCQLAVAERLLQQRLAATLLTRGLTLRDPARFDVRGTLTAGMDCVIDVNCVFEGE